MSVHNPDPDTFIELNKVDSNPDAIVFSFNASFARVPATGTMTLFFKNGEYDGWNYEQSPSAVPLNDNQWQVILDCAGDELGINQRI